MPHYNQCLLTYALVNTSWARTADGKFVNLNTNDQLAVERFGAAGVVISGKRANGEITETYRGRMTGNRIEGTLEYTYASVKLAKPATFPWSASYFYAPAENPATGRHVYAACAAEVSVINTADHSVRAVKVEATGHSVGAIAVSPDSSTAYVSSDGDPFHPATLWVIDGATGTVTRSFNLKDSPTPSGLTSLAVSGDGSTVYGFGWDRKHVWSALVALDPISGAAKASAPVPEGNRAQRLLLAGSKLVLDSGTVVDLPVPSGAPPVFSNGNALSAFPDGARICSGQGVLAVGTGAALRKVPGCGPISPDGTKIYVNGGGSVGMRTLATLPATKLDPEEAITAVSGGALGLAADGKTVFALDGHGAVYTFDTATNLLTDAIRVCEKPLLLGVEPLNHQIAPPSATALAQTKPKGPEAVAQWQPDLVVAVIDGKQITARQASGIIAAAGPVARQQYQSRLPELLQQLYMESQITQEAVGLHLDRTSPWKEQLASAHHDIFPLEIGPGQPTPPNLQAAWTNARQRILWNAYFGQAAAGQARQALLTQKKDRYKIQVQDANFFVETH
jgi:DNA-binding beta-propeller fold protein YncE